MVWIGGGVSLTADPYITTSTLEKSKVSSADCAAVSTDRLVLQLSLEYIQSAKETNSFLPRFVLASRYFKEI